MSKKRPKTERSAVGLPLEKLALFLLLISLTMLFLSFSVGYVFTHAQSAHFQYFVFL